MSNPFQSAGATVAANPFTQPNGGTAPAGANPFLQPTGGEKRFFPKIDQLFGRLVIMRPVKIEMSPKNPDYANFPGEEEEKATIDLVVLDGPALINSLTNEEEPLPSVYEGMWVNQQSLVGQLKGGLRKGQPILGRMYRFAQKKVIEQYPTRQSIEEGLAAWVARGGTGQKPPFTWKLEQYTTDELETAMKWLEANPSFLQ